MDPFLVKKTTVGLFRRYLIYLVDCLVMSSVLAVQLFLVRGEWPLQHHPDDYLGLLLAGHNVWLWTLLLATGYWTIVDYHPTLLRYRGRIVTAEGEQPDLSTRLLRSAVKAFTLFAKPFLVVFALFSKDHTLLHDYLAKTDRVRVSE